MKTALAVRGLRVTYSDAILGLQDVSLTVGQGQLVALLGSNGAGKTTLLRTLSKTLRFSGGQVAAGTIEVNGEPLAGRGPMSAIAAGIAHVPEGRRVFTRLTVEENLRAGGFAAKGSAVRDRAKDRVFGLFPQLADKRNIRAGLLSGGEQQMVAIGRALMGAPTLLLLDEPSLGLSPHMVSRLAEAIRSVNEDGTTVLLVEQNAGMALGIADHAFVLDIGQVTLSGPAAELARSSAVMERYLGGPPRSWDRTRDEDTHGPAAVARSLSRWSQP